MANPPNGTITRLTGAPVFVSTDSTGNSVVPTLPWLFNGDNQFIPSPLPYITAFSVSNLSMTTAGPVTGSTFTAPVAGTLQMKVLCASPTVTDPASALTLVQSSGSSSLATGTYYVAQAQTNAIGSTTIGSSLASIDISTAGNDITTSLDLTPGATGVDIFVGTSNPPLELANVSASGTITYSGGATSGITVAVNGSTLGLTISAPATSSGTVVPTANTTTSPQTLTQTITPNGGTAATGTINGGTALTPGTWYTWDQPMTAGEQISLSVNGPTLITALATLKEG